MLYCNNMCDIDRASLSNLMHVICAWARFAVVQFIENTWVACTRSDLCKRTYISPCRDSNVRDSPKKHNQWHGVNYAFDEFPFEYGSYWHGFVHCCTNWVARQKHVVNRCTVRLVVKYDTRTTSQVCWVTRENILTLIDKWSIYYGRKTYVFDRPYTVYLLLQKWFLAKVEYTDHCLKSLNFNNPNN